MSFCGLIDPINQIGKTYDRQLVLENALVHALE